MAGKQVTELDALPSFTDTSLLPVHNGTGLKKGSLSQLANYLGTKFSNPNLLINPDFKINQRGATSYEQQGYSVDRWKIWNVTVTPNSNGSITIKNDKYTDTGTFIQILENSTEGDSTLSCYVTSVSGTVTMVADDDSQVILKQGLNVVHTSKSTKNFIIFLNQGTSVTLKWVKLEQGEVATEFIAPNPAEELATCKRFTQYYDSIPCIPGVLYVANTTSATSGWLPLYQILSPSMRVVPTISVFSVNANNGNSIGSNYSVSLDNNRLKAVVFKEASNYHTITLNKVLLDAEIY